MRILALFVILMLPGFAYAHAASVECASQYFGEGRYSTTSGKPLLTLPRGISRPSRGVVLFFGGLLLDSKWWIVDVDNQTLTYIMAVGPRHVANYSFNGLRVRDLPGGGVIATNSIKLDSSQLSKFICRANALWSYKSPYEAKVEASERQFKAWEQATARWKVRYKSWKHAADHCQKRSSCAGPAPVPPSAMSVSIPSPPTPSSNTIDTLETVTLLDGRSYRGFGGLGQLQGAASAFADWLMMFPDDHK